jgi:hypothetical protein
MAEKKTRLEIVMSEAIVDDFLERADFAVSGFKYTEIPSSHGRGNTDPKRGDAIWPELNSVFNLYLSEEDAARIVLVVKGLREKYPTEGVSCFKTSGVEEL